MLWPARGAHLLECHILENYTLASYAVILFMKDPDGHAKQESLVC